MRAGEILFASAPARTHRTGACVPLPDGARPAAARRRSAAGAAARVCLAHARGRKRPP